MIKFVKNDFFIYCKEARLESQRSFYGSFCLGPFEAGQSITIANALRRTLLSELKGLAITSAEIEGAFHEYATLPGVRDSILDILLNLKDIVLKSINYGNIKRGTSYTATFKNEQIGYLKTRGPGIVTASDLKLPPGIQCVDPDQYITTLSEAAALNIKFHINEGNHYHTEQQSYHHKQQYQRTFYGFTIIPPMPNNINPVSAKSPEWLSSSLKEPVLRRGIKKERSNFFRNSFKFKNYLRGLDGPFPAVDKENSISASGYPGVNNLTKESGFRSPPSSFASQAQFKIKNRKLKIANQKSPFCYAAFSNLEQSKVENIESSATLTKTLKQSCFFYPRKGGLKRLWLKKIKIIQTQLNRQKQLLKTFNVGKINNTFLKELLLPSFKSELESEGSNTLKLDKVLPYYKDPAIFNLKWLFTKPLLQTIQNKSLFSRKGIEAEGLLNFKLDRQRSYLWAIDTFLQHFEKSRFADILNLKKDGRQRGEATMAGSGFLSSLSETEKSSIQPPYVNFKKGNVLMALSTPLAIDAVFMPINKVNYIIEINEQSVIAKDSLGHNKAAINFTSKNFSKTQPFNKENDKFLKQENSVQIEAGSSQWLSRTNSKSSIHPVKKSFLLNLKRPSQTFKFGIFKIGIEKQPKVKKGTFFRVLRKLKQNLYNNFNCSQDTNTSFFSSKDLKQPFLKTALFKLKYKTGSSSKAAYSSFFKMDKAYVFRKPVEKYYLKENICIVSPKTLLKKKVKRCAIKLSFLRTFYTSNFFKVVNADKIKKPKKLFYGSLIKPNYLFAYKRESKKKLFTSDKLLLKKKAIKLNNNFFGCLQWLPRSKHPVRLQNEDRSKKNFFKIVSVAKLFYKPNFNNIINNKTIVEMGASSFRLLSPYASHQWAFLTKKHFFNFNKEGAKSEGGGGQANKKSFSAQGCPPPPSDFAPTLNLKKAQNQKGGNKEAFLNLKISFFKKAAIDRGLNRRLLCFYSLGKQQASRLTLDKQPVRLQNEDRYKKNFFQMGSIEPRFSQTVEVYFSMAANLKKQTTQKALLFSKKKTLRTVSQGLTFFNDFLKNFEKSNLRIGRQPFNFIKGREPVQNFSSPMLFQSSFLEPIVSKLRFLGIKPISAQRLYSLIKSTYGKGLDRKYGFFLPLILKSTSKGPSVTLFFSAQRAFFFNNSVRKLKKNKEASFWKKPDPKKAYSILPAPIDAKHVLAFYTLMGGLLAIRKKWSLIATRSSIFKTFGELFKLRSFARQQRDIEIEGNIDKQQKSFKSPKLLNTLKKASNKASQTLIKSQKFSRYLHSGFKSLNSSSKQNPESSLVKEKSVIFSRGILLSNYPHIKYPSVAPINSANQSFLNFENNAKHLNSEEDNLNRKTRTADNRILPTTSLKVIHPSNSNPNFKTSLKNNILLEIWTNGSIHPRQALYDACKNLLSIFSKLEKARFTRSIFQSEKSYAQIALAKIAKSNVLSVPIIKNKNFPSFNGSVPFSTFNKLNQTINSDIPYNNVIHSRLSLALLETSISSSDSEKSLISQNNKVTIKNKKVESSVSSNQNQKGSVLNSFKIAYLKKGIRNKEGALNCQRIIKQGNKKIETKFSLAPIWGVMFQKNKQYFLAMPKNHQIAFYQNKKIKKNLITRNQPLFTGSYKNGFYLSKLANARIQNNKLAESSFTKSLEETKIFKKIDIYLKQKQINWNIKLSLADYNILKTKPELVDIGKLNISLRPYTCLKRANINTLKDLLKKSKKELLTLKNFGKQSLKEVEDILEQLGLSLAL